MKEIEFEGQTHEFPDDFTDAEIASALGGGTGQPPAAPSFGQRANRALGTAQRAVGGVLRQIDTLGGRLPGTPSGSFITPESANPVPRTLVEAGGQLGQAVVPARLGALARILGPALGGEAGNQLAGGPMGQGALSQGGAALAGEALSALGSKALRSVPNNPLIGGKRAIAAQDAAAYGGELGRQAPPLAGARTVEDLQRLAQGEGRTALGGAKEQAVQQIEQMIGNRPLSVPALGPTPMTLREANDALSQIGARAFSRNPLDRTIQGIDQRQLYGEVAQQIDRALGGYHPQAPGAFQAAQNAYKKGLALLRPVQAANAYRLSPGETQFNTPAVQAFLQNPRNAAQLRNKLGDADYQALLNVMTRGAGQGKDVLTSGSGGVLDALMQSFGRGQNTGAAQYLGVPLRTLVPNIGSQYVGRQPYSLPPALQQILDVVLQRAAVPQETP